MIERDGVPAMIGYVGESIQVIFEKPFKMVSPFDGQIETSAPTALAYTADLGRTGTGHGSVITVGETDYQVVGMEPVSTAHTELTLTKDF